FVFYRNRLVTNYYFKAKLQSVLILKMPHFPDEIEYSEKYQDDNYEYRHVLLPRQIYKQMPHNRLLLEHEWRSLGV
ncbi:MAG: hypothetical protein ACK55Z_06750, partial [bacterium]